MLDWAEMSVAPSNAPPDKGALEHAKTISTFDNDEDFVADFIERELAKGKSKTVKTYEGKL